MYAESTRNAVNEGDEKSPETALVREADARTRTADPFITSEVLYQLSYVGAPRIVGASHLLRRAVQTGTAQG